jgi:hypothetical protein
MLSAYGTTANRGKVEEKKKISVERAQVLGAKIIHK